MSQDIESYEEKYQAKVKTETRASMGKLEVPMKKHIYKLLIGSCPNRITSDSICKVIFNIKVNISYYFPLLCNSKELTALHFSLN